MFQPKVRRVVPVLALAAALSLIPLADASAARRASTAPKKPARALLLVQVEAQLASFWEALQSMWSDAGVRMDDNG